MHKKSEHHYAINWTDGVKLTKDHFIESYFNYVDSIRSSVQTRLHSYDYGMLAAKEGMLSALEIETQIHTEERLVLALHNCNALTAGGCKIEYTATMYGGDYPTATIEAKDIDTNNNLEFYVVVVINPFELVPVGEPDPEVIPLHHPSVLPKISLKIIPKNQFNDDFLDTYFLVVNKVYWRNGSFIIDKEYVPAVARIKYHKLLHGFYRKISESLIRLRTYSIIIHKKNRDKVVSNSLVRNTFLLSNKVMDFVSQQAFQFNQIGEESPPVYIVQKVSILANYLSNELAIMEDVEKEKLLQYYYEWIDVKPSEFEATLGDILSINYDHKDINASLTKVDYFMAVMDKLWKRLSDLEYIGQRKDNIIIGEESSEVKPASKNKPWSIID